MGMRTAHDGALHNRENLAPKAAFCNADVRDAGALRAHG